MEVLNNSLGQIGAQSSVELINEAQYNVILQVFAVVPTPVAAFGVVVNVINIRAFYILGLSDGVTINFFGLSICDFIYLFLYLLMRFFLLLPALEYMGLAWYPIDPYVLVIFTSHIAMMASLLSMFIVTFLAVVRSLCVYMPLHFKFIFTQARCKVFMVTFALVSVCVYSPIIGNMGVRRRFDPRRNASRFFMWFSPDRNRIKDATWLVSDTSFPVIVEVVFIVCAILMANALRKSAKFRKAQGNGSSAAHEALDDSRHVVTEVKLSSRDLRVVYQVIVISIIYIVANLPKIFNAVYTQFEPGFDVGGRFHYFYLLLSDTRMLFECINATVNFFVYYKFNSGFRAVCFAFKKQTKR